MTVNPELNLTLDDAVGEVLGLLTGLDLEYAPELDRYRAVTRQLNRALRSNALEREWSWYASTQSIGTTVEGMTEVMLTSTKRPRVIGDDAIRFVNSDGVVVGWAYFLPRDALHKYQSRNGIWAAATRQSIAFSRPFTAGEEDLDIQVPVMREPTMFRLPAQPEDPNDPLVDVPDEIREQPIDFGYPDIITLRAAYYVAQSDPVLQPRVQTLEAQYKDLMYQLIERDERSTDSPELNPFFVPISSGLHDVYTGYGHLHPHADERR